MRILTYEEFNTHALRLFNGFIDSNDFKKVKQSHAAQAELIEEQEGLLKEVEWQAFDNGIYTCRWCHNTKEQGHAPGCKYVAGQERR